MCIFSFQFRVWHFFSSLPAYTPVCGTIYRMLFQVCDGVRWSLVNNATSNAVFLNSDVGRASPIDKQPSIKLQSWLSTYKLYDTQTPRWTRHTKAKRLRVVGNNTTTYFAVIPLRHREDDIRTWMPSIAVFMREWAQRRSARERARKGSATATLAKRFDLALSCVVFPRF